MRILRTASPLSGLPGLGLIPLALFATVLVGVPAFGEEISVQTARPVVIQTNPPAGSDQVDPKLTQIQITFSKDMADQSWSFVKYSDASYPQTTSNPSYLKNKRTCILPVKLEPGKTYALWINSEQFDNFKDSAGRPAVPYLLVFQTKPAIGGAAPKPVAFEYKPAILGRLFDELWTDMDRHYSYFAYKPDVDWKKLHDRYRPEAMKAKDRLEFVSVLRKMLAPLKDLHVWIETPDGPVNTYRGGYRRNWNREATLAILENRIDCGFAMVGKTPLDGFGYFLMVRQGDANAASVKKAVSAIQSLHGAPGFIVDLRAASGGNEALAREIAQLFCARPALYARSRSRSGPQYSDLTPAYDRILPASPKPYTGPVVCLIGSGTVSSGEGFVQMLKCLLNVTTVGQRTRGASGNPAAYRLTGTGLAVWYSRWVDLMPDGSVFEDKGITPDVAVDEPLGAYFEEDPTVQRGLKILREKLAAKKAKQ